MELHKLYLNILQNPFSIKNYRELELYYFKKAMHREANAFGKLIGERFQNDTHNNDHLSGDGERAGGDGPIS